ncbi:cytochrome c oxidase assembly factor 8 isoform X2 [Ptiloglossa arizonensis]|uniref:cytochrome c oxidase assembly factor 8 isoform X2 n=1 Tax=Ptiloglossa arizonensis TaxID=3350558 RepID=UPI003F9ED9B6
MARACNYTQVKLYNNIIRLLHTKTHFNLKTPLRTDIIGPPDPISNLRPIIFAKYNGEKKLETQYRKAREDTQLWNQNFWTQHNTSFIENFECTVGT